MAAPSSMSFGISPCCDGVQHVAGLARVCAHAQLDARQLCHKSLNTHNHHHHLPFEMLFAILFFCLHLPPLL
jgi:hypothetical protein